MMAPVSKSSHNKGGRVKPCTDEEILHEYFRLIKTKDMYGLLDLFTDDAVIYEPFSKSEDGKGGLQGKSAIEPFLNVSMMANDGLKVDIDVEKSKLRRDNDINKVIAYVTFERGGKVKAGFTFELTSEENYNSQKQKKIQSLRIQFVE
jgi:ketosteroid isomerase-like protein